MKINLRRSVLLIALFMLSSSLSYSQKGWWLFDNPTNLTAAVPGFGTDLELTGSDSAVAGPTAGNGATRIGIGSYYKLTLGFAPNGGGSTVNEYSLMFDFKVPTLGVWYTFFQTNMTNSNDADFFIRQTGEIGQGNPGYTYSTFQVSPNLWYRLIVSVDLGNFFRYYVDGVLIHEGNSQSIDGQFGLDPWMFLFADNDGDDAEFDIAEVTLWDYPLSAAEVLALGTVGTVVPVELTSFTAVQSLGNVTLLWSTATELNNNGFEVQRKDQQSAWKIVGFVQGNGTSTITQNYSFVDRAENSGKYSYRLKQIDFNGTFAYSDAVEVEIVPAEFKLFNNYPNPFNPSTIISYNLPIDAFVTLRIYNSVGELVTELVNGYQTAGQYNQHFNSSSNGQSFPSGIYFAELKANEKVQRIKMMLLK